MKGGIAMRISGTILLAIALMLHGANSNGQATAQEKPNDEKIVWGKVVNGLAASIAPAKEPGQIQIRWKNVGQQTLELPWVRFGSDAIYKDLDDLWHHVFLKKPDGEFVPVKKYQFPEIGGPPYRPRTVFVEPGKMHQETINLWTYVNKPSDGGTYRLWVELNIKSPFATKDGAKYWTGKIQSNRIEIKLPKSDM
jgi:hypothetical protein